MSESKRMHPNDNLLRGITKKFRSEVTMKSEATRTPPRLTRQQSYSYISSSSDQQEEEIDTGNHIKMADL